MSAVEADLQVPGMRRQVTIEEVPGRKELFLAKRDCLSSLDSPPNSQLAEARPFDVSPALNALTICCSSAAMRASSSAAC